MDILCSVCSEPWEMDSLHDEVERRYPNKPWYVDTKPEPYHEPDKIENWCNYRDEGYFCGENKDSDVHTTEMMLNHPFNAHVSKSYKSYNTWPHFNPTVGKWLDDKIYADHYDPISKEFRRTGCAVFGVKHNDTKANPAYAYIYEILGDDLDGAAAMIEDMDYMGDY